MSIGLVESVEEISFAPTPLLVSVRERKPYDVYIGRANSSWKLAASKWGNPFKTAKAVPGHGVPFKTCLQKYLEYVQSSPHLMAALSELHGKVLACWCAPQPCHGHILIHLANLQAQERSA